MEKRKREREEGENRKTDLRNDNKKRKKEEKLLRYTVHTHARSMKVPFSPLAAARKASTVHTHARSMNFPFLLLLLLSPFSFSLSMVFIVRAYQ
jgi:hypothetical protein